MGKRGNMKMVVLALFYVLVKNELVKHVYGWPAGGYMAMAYGGRSRCSVRSVPERPGNSDTQAGTWSEKLL